MSKTSTSNISPPRHILLRQSIRAIEAAHHADSDSSMMRRAARAAFEFIQSRWPAPQTVAILCGRGNNAGDGYYLAEHLIKAAYPITLCCPLGEPNTAQARAARAQLQARPINPDDLLQQLNTSSTPILLVDALFGIGLTRPIDSNLQRLMQSINDAVWHKQHSVLALDLPSGLDADNGHSWGAIIKATHTLSFLALKAGMFSGLGPDYCGAIHLDNLTIPCPAANADAQLIDGPELFSHAVLRPRAANSHKGNFGDAVIIGGAPGMLGAAILAGRAALKIGAGRVLLNFVAEHFPPYDAGQPELMLSRADARTIATLAGNTACAIAIGPGLGQGSDAGALLATVLSSAAPLVIDADALNLISKEPALARQLTRRQATSIITPHPAEAARLLQSNTMDIQSNRLAAAHELATRYQCICVLKGVGSIISASNQPSYINSSGNPSLATAGTGDILTGLLCGLLAQGIAPFPAALAGVHLHGVAADDLLALGIGPHGMAAGELINAARQRFNLWHKEFTGMTLDRLDEC